MQYLNNTMLSDFYEFTMSNGFFESGMENETSYFDLFFRKIPDGGGFAIMAGLAQVIEYIKNLSFSAEDIKYLSETKAINEKFLNYIKDFKFECDIWAIKEGTPIFPNEPILTVRGPIVQAQFIETMLLILINHQSLIATKANRVVRAAKKRKIMEFGARRAQGIAAAVYGARAAYIAGCSSTSCTLAGKNFGIPVSGTMAHSWVQIFDDELSAFREYAKTCTESCTLLIDTYDTIGSGLPNAIKVFKEYNFRKKAVRIDSGDLAYLTRKTRKILDKNNLSDCKIIASNALDEYIIKELIEQDAKIDIFGVGERLITSSSEPVFSGVYKLCAIEKNNEVIPKIKISENVGKITLPCFKQLYRLFNKDTNMAIADLITLHDEELNHDELEIFDPVYVWKRKRVNNFYAVKLLEPIFIKGKCVYNPIDLKEIRSYCKREVKKLWPEILRFENPHKYYVDLSQKLWDINHDMLNKYSKS